MKKFFKKSIFYLFVNVFIVPFLVFAVFGVIAYLLHYAFECILDWAYDL